MSFFELWREREKDVGAELDKLTNLMKLDRVRKKTSYFSVLFFLNKGSEKIVSKSSNKLFLKEK